MARLHKSALGYLILAAVLATGTPCITGAAEPQAATATVLGGGNSLLAEGSLALEEGRIAEGIRLTEAGLKDAADPREVAGGHSNLCAGYALLRDWAQALEHCNTAIELDHSNWHSLNNRAAVHVGQGRYDLALGDLRLGLELVPQSTTLHKSLAVVEHNQRVLNKRDRALMHS
jgi:tetratricopeptide (TPR) repeat protein